MDINIDPPRHHADSSICYRAVLSGDCPMSHVYPLLGITENEKVQLEWIRSLMPRQEEPQPFGSFGGRARLTVDTRIGDEIIRAGEWGTTMGVTGAHIIVDFDAHVGQWGIDPAHLTLTLED